MRHLRQVGLAVLALTVAGSSVASAQRTRPRTPATAQTSGRVWELGVDAELSFGLDDPNTTSLGIPIGNFRAAWSHSDVLSIEPFGALNYFKVEGFDATTTYMLGVGALYHFSTDRSKSQAYARPFLALAGISTSGASDSDLGFGVGIGMKWPRLGGRIAWRGEANVAQVGDATSLNALFGLSFFTR
jgi:hypothetical protein